MAWLFRDQRGLDSGTGTKVPLVSPRMPQIFITIWLQVYNHAKVRLETTESRGEDLLISVVVLVSARVYCVIFLLFNLIHYN